MKRIALFLLLGIFFIHVRRQEAKVCCEKVSAAMARDQSIAPAGATPIVLASRPAVPPRAPSPPLEVVDVDDLEPSIALQATPSWFWGDDPETGDNLNGPLTIKGRPSATEERAEADARLHLVRLASEWLAPDVPAAWEVPGRLVDAMIADRYVETVEKDYGTIYLAALRVDFTSEHRAAIVEAYNRQLVSHRLVLLGGCLGFALACLAATTGYIRADEATKGYYTNRLRVLAAAGVGGAGVALYHALA